MLYNTPGGIKPIESDPMKGAGDVCSCDVWAVRQSNVGRLRVSMEEALYGVPADERCGGHPYAAA